MRNWNWYLIATMSDEQPLSPMAPGGDHKMMAYQWWCDDGSGKKPQRAATSVKPGDNLHFLCVKNGNYAGTGAMMNLRFNKNLGDGSVVPDFEFTSRMKQVRPNHFFLQSDGIKGAAFDGGEFKDCYQGFTKWELAIPVEDRSRGEFTFQIDAHLAGSNMLYFLDPLLRVDPETKKK